MNQYQSEHLKVPFHTLPNLHYFLYRYMRGRESVDDLRNFLDTVIVTCFNKKYQLMHRQRSTVRNRQDLELWKVYNQQASYVPGSSQK